MYFEEHLTVLRLTKHFRSSFLTLQSCYHAVFFRENSMYVLFYFQLVTQVVVDFHHCLYQKATCFRIFPVLATKCKCVLMHLLVLEYFRAMYVVKLITNTLRKYNIQFFRSQKCCIKYGISSFLSINDGTYSG